MSGDAGPGRPATAPSALAAGRISVASAQARTQRQAREGSRTGGLRRDKAILSMDAAKGRLKASAPILNDVLLS